MKALMDFFYCIICKRQTLWEKGADDDMPDACDSCWAKAHGKKGRGS